MLSLLLTVPGATQKAVIELCSVVHPVNELGQQVWVAASMDGPVQGRKVLGKLVGMDESSGLCIVDVEDKSAHAAASTRRVQVSSKLVRSVKTVLCTYHQIKAALCHAAVRYPGAPVPKLARSIERLDATRAKFVSDWLAQDTVSERVAASNQNARSGRKYQPPSPSPRACP